MIVCYLAMRADSGWAQRLQDPSVSIHPSVLRQTKEEAWEIRVNSRHAWVMVRWEWRGETTENGWWRLTNPQLGV